MKLKLTQKTSYGVERFYPECDISRSMASLMGQSTFTRDQLKVMKKMGFELENVTPRELI